MGLMALALQVSAAEPLIPALPSRAQTSTGPVLPADSQAAGAAGSQSTATNPTIDMPAPAPASSPEGDTPSAATLGQSDIIVTARPRGDPLRRANVVSFQATQAVDDAVIGPAAHTYEHVVPKPVRGGLRNFFYNLHEPTVFLNYLVQLKPGKAAETLGRFAVNTTIGVVGVMDVAKRRPFNLPRRPNSFSDSLGYYGVKPGPFLFLPLIGPTTLRDLLGGGIDRLAVPSLVGGQLGGTAYVATTGSIKLLDRRLRLDDDLRVIRTGSENPYAARRALYLRKRQAEIDGLHSKHRHGGAEPEVGGLSNDPPAQETGQPAVPSRVPDVGESPSLGSTPAGSAPPVSAFMRKPEAFRQDVAPEACTEPVFDAASACSDRQEEGLKVTDLPK